MSILCMHRNVIEKVNFMVFLIDTSFWDLISCIKPCWSSIFYHEQSGKYVDFCVFVLILDCLISICSNLKFLDLHKSFLYRCPPFVLSFCNVLDLCKYLILTINVVSLWNVFLITRYVSVQGLQILSNCINYETYFHLLYMKHITMVTSYV